MEYSGAGGKLIHHKNKKSRDTVPLRHKMLFSDTDVLCMYSVETLYRLHEENAN
jgi:hypothetical protein